MRDYEIIKIQIDNNIRAEIEFLDDRTRQVFVYPLGQGWEIDTVNNVPKFIDNIKQRVTNAEFDKNIITKTKATSIKKHHTIQQILAGTWLFLNSIDNYIN